MKHIIYLSMVILVVSSTLTFGDDYGGGYGTAEEPYLIYTPEQMLPRWAERVVENV